MKVSGSGWHEKILFSFRGLAPVQRAVLLNNQISSHVNLHSEVKIEALAHTNCIRIT